jgi:uncharacterized protein (DUF1778 family)
MTERLTIALDPHVAAQLRSAAALGGESVEDLAGRLLAAVAETIADPPASRLTQDQVADLRERLKSPGPFATDAEVDAFFSRFGA